MSTSLYIIRVEELIQSMHGQLRRISLKPQWQDVNESDTLFMTENSRITGREKLLKTNFSEDEKEDKMNGEDPEDRRCSKHLKAALSAHSDVWSLGGIDSKTRMLRWTPLHCCIVGWACASAIGFKGSGTNLCAKRALGTPPLNEAAILSKNLFKQSLQSEGSNGGGGTIPRFTNSGGFSGISHAREKQNHNKSRMDDTLVRNNIFCNTLKAGKHQMTSLTLLKNGAFVDSLDSKARTPLMLAAASNLLDAITLLLDAGADMGLRDNIGGNTALHYAYAAGSMAAASLLEERGADINVLNCAGKSPIDVTGVMSSIGGGITNVYAI